MTEFVLIQIIQVLLHGHLQCILKLPDDNFLLLLLLLLLLLFIPYLTTGRCFDESVARHESPEVRV